MHQIDIKNVPTKSFNSPKISEENVLQALPFISGRFATNSGDQEIESITKRTPPPHSPAKTRRVGIDVNKRKAYKGPFYTILFVVGNVLNQAMH